MQDKMPEGDGIKGAALRFANGAAGLARARLELASVELAEERERVHQRLTLMFAGVLLLVFGALGLGMLIVVFFWDTHRLWAIVVPSLAFAVLGFYLLRRAANVGKDGGLPFSATLAEFDKDRVALQTMSRAATPPETTP